MNNKEELKTLTSKFIRDFVELSGENSDTYAFNFILPKVLGEIPLPSYEERTFGLLLGMSEFDTKIADMFFQKRLQGFVSIIESKLKSKKEQDDYYIKDITNGTHTYEDIKFKNREVSFIKKTGRSITFKVENHRSGFEGHVKLLYQKQRLFPDKHKEKGIIKEVVRDVIFTCRDTVVMSIHMDINSDMNTLKEVGEVKHFKYISEINSFYQTILCI